MAYENVPGQQVPQGQEMVACGNDPYGYSYPGDMFPRGSNDQAAQVRKAIFECDVPKTADEFEQWVPMLRVLIDTIPRVPGYDAQIWAELNRDFEDLVDRAHSQGRSKVVASKMQKFFFKVRSLVPKSDIQLPGLSGVGAMITTTTNQKQEIRMPQQPATQSFLSTLNPFSKRGP
jgi:hypothetical protein